MTANQVPGRALTTEDRYWAERATRLERTSLTELRATAEKWRGGLTTLTGLIATALAVGTPFIGDTVASEGVRLGIGIGMTLAVVVLGTATWLAMLAAFGTPSEINNSGPALREWSTSSAKNAKCYLAWARGLTIGGFAVLLATAGIGLFGTSAAADPSSVALKNKTEYCGEVTFKDSGTTVVVTAEDGTVHSTPLAEVASIHLESGC